jgi:hypothetical protein
VVYGIIFTKTDEVIDLGNYLVEVRGGLSAPEEIMSTLGRYTLENHCREEWVW